MDSQNCKLLWITSYPQHLKFQEKKTFNLLPFIFKFERIEYKDTSSKTWEVDECALYIPSVMTGLLLPLYKQTHMLYLLTPSTANFCPVYCTSWKQSQIPFCVNALVWK